MTRISLNPTADEIDLAVANGDGERHERDDIQDGETVHWPVFIHGIDNTVRLCLIAEYDGDIERAVNRERFLRLFLTHNWFVDPNDPVDFDLLNCPGCIAQRRA